MTVLKLSAMKAVLNLVPKMYFQLSLVFSID
jgi:hypothetical protein